MRKMGTREVIRIPDATGMGDYDNWLFAPENMNEIAAVEIVDAAIIAVKAADPEGFVFEDLMNVLEPQGFEACYPTTTGEEW